MLCLRKLFVYLMKVVDSCVRKRYLKKIKLLLHDILPLSILLLVIITITIDDDNYT